MCRLPTRVAPFSSDPAVGAPVQQLAASEDALFLPPWDPADVVFDNDVTLPDVKNDLEFFAAMESMLGSDASDSGSRFSVPSAILPPAGVEPFVKQEEQQQLGTVEAFATQQPLMLPPAMHVSLSSPAMVAVTPNLVAAQPVVPTNAAPTLAYGAQAASCPAVPAPQFKAEDAPPAKPYATKRRSKKTPAEIEAQQERIRKRRRESAQRSRARKNCYVSNLEADNRALRLENETLRLLLRQAGGGTGCGRTFAPLPPREVLTADTEDDDGDDLDTPCGSVLNKSSTMLVQ